MTNSLRDRFRDAPALRSVASRYRALPRGTNPTPVTRFAPSPTGELHLGHVAHALWVWGVAEVLDATVIVRMEDHDRGRCSAAFEASILADLAWLGFTGEPLSMASLSGHPSPYRQSDVPERYLEAFARLGSATEVYGCSCTRAQLGPADADRERRYPGTCRGMPIDREGRHVIRAQLPAGLVVCPDLLLGTLSEDPQLTCGDITVRDALGQWTYQFSVVVDDLAHGVDLVVRGEDLAHSTARQAVLARLLGRSAPLITLHHPLVVDEHGRKLSKRDRSLTVRAMREAGKSAEEILEEGWRSSRIGDPVVPR
ncbi:MAG: glutamate--tRNA ligase family protein [Gemmatimonadales bacterium]